MPKIYQTYIQIYPNISKYIQDISRISKIYKILSGRRPGDRGPGPVRGPGLGPGRAGPGWRPLRIFVYLGYPGYILVIFGFIFRYIVGICLVYFVVCFIYVPFGVSTTLCVSTIISQPRDPRHGKCAKIYPAFSR